MKPQYAAGRRRSLMFFMRSLLFEIRFLRFACGVVYCWDHWFCGVVYCWDHWFDDKSMFYQTSQHLSHQDRRCPLSVRNDNLTPNFFSGLGSI